MMESNALWKMIGVQETSSIPNLDSLGVTEMSNNSMMDLEQKQKEQGIRGIFHMKKLSSPQVDSISLSPVKCQSQVNFEVYDCSSEECIDQTASKFIANSQVMKRNLRFAKNQLLKEIRFLHIEKDRVKEFIDLSLQSFRDYFQFQFHKISNQLQKKQSKVVQCTKCNHSRMLVEALTKQCWQLETCLEEFKKKQQTSSQKQLTHSIEKLQQQILLRSTENKQLTHKLQLKLKENIKLEALIDQNQQREALLTERNLQYNYSLVKIKQLLYKNQTATHQLEQAYQNELAYLKSQMANQYENLSKQNLNLKNKAEDQKNKMNLLNEKYSSVCSDYSNLKVKYQEALKTPRKEKPNLLDFAVLSPTNHNHSQQVKISNSHQRSFEDFTSEKNSSKFFSPHIVAPSFAKDKSLRFSPYQNKSEMVLDGSDRYQKERIIAPNSLYEIKPRHLSKFNGSNSRTSEVQNRKHPANIEKMFLDLEAIKKKVKDHIKVSGKNVKNPNF